jgi:AcrR family transcriptional regulator
MQPPFECRTKSAILNAAERLFASYGFEGASLRTITAEAGANLGAVNYHFQTKGGLILEVLKRMFKPVNEERLRLLGEAEARAKGNPAPVEAILDALFRPPLALVNMPSDAGWFYPRLLAFCLTEPGSYLKPLVAEEFAQRTGRFVSALEHACPGLTQEEVRWRFHFAMGAFINTVGNPQVLEIASQGMCRIENIDETLNRLVHYCAAGFRAGITKA